MLDKDAIEHTILSLGGVSKSYPFDKSLAVYEANGQMFAILKEDKQPLLLSLRCDTRLAQLLREKYETVMPGQKLDKKKWNTLVLSGQLPPEEVSGMIRHAFELVNNNELTN